MGPDWPSFKNKHTQQPLWPDVISPSLSLAVLFSTLPVCFILLSSELFVIVRSVPHIPGVGSSNRRTHRSLPMGCISRKALAVFHFTSWTAEVENELYLFPTKVALGVRICIIPVITKQTVFGHRFPFSEMAPHDSQKLTKNCTYFLHEWLHCLFPCQCAHILGQIIGKGSWERLREWL